MGLKGLLHAMLFSPDHSHSNSRSKRRTKLCSSSPDGLLFGTGADTLSSVQRSETESRQLAMDCSAVRCLHTLLEQVATELFIIIIIIQSF